MNTDRDSGGKPELTMDTLSLVLMGHAAFQYLYACCQLGLFELIRRRGPMDRAQIRKELRLEDRATDVLLLGATSLGLLKKNAGAYTVAAVIDDLIRAGQWDQFVDVVVFEHEIVNEGQRDFLESIVTNTNVGIRRVPGAGEGLYRRLAENPRLQQVFYRYMRSWSQLAHSHLASVDLGRARTLLDCGGGDAVNAIELVSRYPGLRATVVELPESAVYTRAAIAESPDAARLDVLEGDMFEIALPTGFDCVLFSHQLVIWTLEENITLLTKAYHALAPGGTVIILNSMSNDEGDGPIFAALDSAYFASMPAEGGMIYSWAQHEQCLQAAGFGQVRRISGYGWTPHGVIVATKQPFDPHKALGS
ncbi:methyltransferase [Amycolatopsis japonica]